MSLKLVCDRCDKLAQNPLRKPPGWNKILGKHLCELCTKELQKFLDTKAERGGSLR